MPKEWYYKHNDAIIGPLSASQLRDAVATGSITQNTAVKCSKYDKWVLAKKVNGLFSDTRTPTLPAQVVSHHKQASYSSRARKTYSIVLASVAVLSVSIFVVRKYYPSDERIAERVRQELKQSSDGWEEVAFYRSKFEISEGDYTAVHAVYNEGSSRYWFGASTLYGNASEVTITPITIIPAKATSQDEVAKLRFNSDRNIESEKYHKLAYFSDNLQAVLRIKAKEFHRAVNNAIGN